MPLGFAPRDKDRCKRSAYELNGLTPYNGTKLKKNTKMIDILNFKCLLCKQRVAPSRDLMSLESCEFCNLSYDYSGDVLFVTKALICDGMLNWTYLKDICIDTYFTLNPDFIEEAIHLPVRIPLDITEKRLKMLLTFS